MSLQDAKAALRRYVEAQRYPGPDSREALKTFFGGSAQINVVHPFNALTRDDYWTQVLQPLMACFSSPIRTDYMAFAGTYEDQTWVTCTGYYSGHFDSDWLGIKAPGRMAHLRFGEFHRMEQGQAVESYIFLDLPELMAACGQWPIAESPGHHRGYIGYVPGPITQDGLQWQMNDPDHSQSSTDMVTTMLRGLATPDQKWRPYWHDRMTWYGPGAFGAFVGLDEFAGFQTTFEGAFSEWIGGAAPGSRTRHFTRFGDGDYVCSGGWPSLNCVQSKSFFGQPPSGKRIYMRVCDWWRREGDLLAENWIFVDVPHVLLQLGVDVFEDRPH